MSPLSAAQQVPATAVPINWITLLTAIICTLAISAIAFIVFAIAKRIRKRKAETLRDTRPHRSRD